MFDVLEQQVRCHFAHAQIRQLGAGQRRKQRFRNRTVIIVAGNGDLLGNPHAARPQNPVHAHCHFIIAATNYRRRKRQRQQLQNSRNQRPAVVAEVRIASLHQIRIEDNIRISQSTAVSGQSQSRRFHARLQSHISNPFVSALDNSAHQAILPCFVIRQNRRRTCQIKTVDQHHRATVGHFRQQYFLMETCHI